MGALLSQFMNKYPYTDFHELNADWLIKTLMEMINQVENFVSLNAIKYADPIQWNITSQYEKNTIVIDPLSGTAYISVQPVPMGVALTNTDYWTVVFDLGSFVVRAAKNFTNRYETDTTLTATFGSSQGDWLVWGDVLYEVIIPTINAGDQYVVDSNIRHITMEEIADALAQAIDAVDTKVGDLDDLDTNDKTSIVEAINSVVSSRNEIIVNVKDFGAVGDGVTDDLAAIDAAIDYLKPTGGTIFFPAGIYAISAPIHIGDGTARTTTGTNVADASTYNSIKFIGVGCQRVGSPTVTQIQPLNSMDCLIYVDGQIANIEISKMVLWANGLAQYGLYICAVSHSVFTDIYIYNPTVAGLTVMGGALPTGNYNVFNTFERIIVVLNTNNTIGLLMDGVLIRDGVPVNNDSWISSFADCRFQAQPSVSGATLGMFKFVDNITFIRCHFVGGDNTTVGVEFNALSSAPSNPFPSGISLIDCSVKSYNVVEDTINGLYIGHQTVINAGANDGEVLPRNSKISGYDANGRNVGGFCCTYINTYDDLVEACVTLPTNKAINVMLSQTFTQTYIGYVGYYSGVAQRISDNYVQINVIGNEGSLFVIFDLTTATRVTWGKVDSRPNLSTIAEVSAICSLLQNGENANVSLLPAFMNTYFSEVVTSDSYGVLQKTSSTLADLYIDCVDEKYYVQFNPTTETIITSGKLSHIKYMRFTTLADLVSACQSFTWGDTILFECDATVTNDLAGVSTESQGSIVYSGGGSIQVEFSNNIGCYYARIRLSDSTILASGYVNFTQNP